MRVDIDLGGRRRAVDVRREGDDWVVTVDGRSFRASIAPSGGRWSVLVGLRSYEVSFDARGGGDYVVHVDGQPVPLAVVPPRVGLRRRAHESDAVDFAPKTVVAPMPGRIVKVLVKPGDAVAARQGVVVVEAMKMENELRAPRAGTIAEVRVAEGSSVEANTVLVVLE